MWGTLFFPGPPRHLMIFSIREFGREFLDPQLHHVMDFPFPFMTVLAGLAVLVVLGSTLPWFCWSYKIQDKEATVTVLAVSVVTATPLKLNPPFPSSWKWGSCEQLRAPLSAPLQRNRRQCSSLIFHSLVFRLKETKENHPNTHTHTHTKDFTALDLG